MRPYSLPFGGWVYRRGGAGSLEVSRFSLFYTHKLRFQPRFQGVSLRSKLKNLAGPYITHRKQSARQQCPPFSSSRVPPLVSLPCAPCLVLFLPSSSPVFPSPVLSSRVLVPSSSLLPVFCVGVLLAFCLSMLWACVVLIVCAACVRVVLLLCFRLLPFTPYFVNSDFTILMYLVCICKEIRKSEGKSVKKQVHFIAQLNILPYLCSTKRNKTN